MERENTGEPGSAPDLEYDLAHEVPDHGDTHAPGTRDTEGKSVQVSTQTDYDGDYGYDLAHDIPRSSNPRRDQAKSE